VRQPKSLGKTTFVGVVATALQTLLGVGSGLFGQLAAAYFLTPEHFATVALALTVVSVTSVLQSAGLAEVLVNRRKAFRAWLPYGQHLAVRLGLLAGGLTIMMSPLAASVYQDNKLVPLCCVFALAQIVHGFSVTPTTRLQNQLKFVWLAKSGLASSVTAAVLLVLCSVLGLGAFSFGISRVGQVAVFTALVLWVSGADRSSFNPVLKHPKRKWFLMKEASLLMLVSATATVCLQADYFALRRYHSVVDVGLYYFAFTVAGRTAQLIGGSVSSVIQPVLASTQTDPGRQSSITVRMIRMIAAVGYPLTFLQAAAIPMIFHQALPTKWIPSIEMAQILSIGMGANMVCGIGWGLLKVQRRVGTLLALNAVAATIFVVAALVLAKIGTPIWVAVLVVVHCLVYTQILVGIVHQSLQLGWLRSLSCSGGYMAIAGILALLLWQLTDFGQATTLSRLPAFILQSVVYLLGCYSLLCAFDRGLIQEFRPALSKFSAKFRLGSP